MEKQRRKRGPRGKYARYICQRCRSRKIKCALPNPDDIQYFGCPLTEEKACERCRSLGLECIVEATILGRPSHRRGPLDSRDYPTTTTVDGNVSTVGSEENVPSPAISDIKEYFYTDIYDNGDDGDNVGEQDAESTSPKSSKTKLEESFQAMVDPAHFFTSVLAHDQAFGSTTPHAMSRFNISLLDLISGDMAVSLDKRLVWHRFFTPQTPTLVGIRNRLKSTGSASSKRCSTNLLFALLCLIALEMPGNPFPTNNKSLLVKNIKLAVSTYGQMFIFSPPIHQDSFTVSLLLANYKPTALVSSQSVAHVSINSDLYFNIAYRIAGHMNLLPTQIIGQLRQTTDFHSLENFLVQSSQAFQTYCADATLNEFFIKPIETMQQILEPLRPLVELYRSTLKSYQCRPIVIFHIQYAIATFLKMDAIASIKQNWDDLDRVSIVIEMAEKRALELLEFNDESLQNWSDHGHHDQLRAIQSLLELRSEWVPLYVCGVGIVCAIASKARSEGIKTGNGAAVTSYEEIAKIGSRAIDILKDGELQNERRDNFTSFVGHFGNFYRKRLYFILEKLISCIDNLRLDGVQFQPPRPLVLEGVMLCKHIIENCLVSIQVHNRLREDFDENLEKFAKFVEGIKGMIASSPWQSIDEAFAGGCVYAASNKVAHGLYEVMEGLKAKANKMAEAKAASERQSAGNEAMEPITNLNSIGLDNWDPIIHLEGWDPWSHFSGYSIFDDLQQESFDWSSVGNLFPEAQ